MNRIFNWELYDRKSSFSSPKCGTIHCPDSYSKKACIELDRSPDILHFSFRNNRFRYFNSDENQFAYSWIDFDLETTKGQTFLQIIPEELLSSEVIIDQIEAIEAITEDLHITFQIWSEKDLFGDNPAYQDCLIRFLC